MTQRLNPYAGNYLPLVQPLIDQSKTIQGRLDPKLAKLIESRASQINGCAVWLHMHTEYALKLG
jgi:AhpD family alkylhydroperoxidase